MASSSCSSSSSSSEGRCFDVFLSFCGDDVRTGFADHLYHALVRDGIRTYRDENELPKGDKIGPKLITAIQDSKISIPIFSKHYTSTKWCLNELVEIFNCKKTKDQVIFPIFYKIEPRDVRNKEEFLPKTRKRNEEDINVNAFEKYNLCLNEYQKLLVEINAEVFEKHQKKNEEKIVQQWKEAVKEVGELVGWHLKKGMYKGRLIKEVVKTIQIELQESRSILPDNLVGIQSHIENMLDRLDIESNDRKTIVVHGLGGIGKTTIAKAVYSKVLSYFEEHKFIENIRDKVEKYGIEYLQNQLITDILGEEKHNITNVSDGIKLIERKFYNRKVLIVLDDVDKSDQVKFLVGNGEQFGIGSRLIITSRKKDIIIAPKPRIYEPQVMNPKNSLVLFCLYAFQSDRPPIDYLDLSTKIVETTGGLPLALRVIGSSLYSWQGRSKWEKVLRKLQKFPNTDVMKSLKVSYDELDFEEKQIFLDIACLLIGEDKDIACHFWEGCGFCAQEGLDSLCARSLLTINEYNELKMHDQLRDLGRQIVYEENERKLGKRSRIWCEEEAFEVLKSRKGTSKVRGLHVKHNKCLTSEGFAAMTELRLLHVEYANLSGNITNSFSELRWLKWKEFPLERYPIPNFCPEKLVILDLSYSNMSDEWIGWERLKVAVNLKVLDLMGCKGLSRTPDVSRNPLLEVLILKHCEKLKVMDKSIYYLRNLIILDMSHCQYLKDLPSEISQLTSLKRLYLEGCSSLITLPEKLGHLISLEEINLSDCFSLVELPNELCRLTSLESLKLNGCRTLQKLPEKLGCMTSLTTLDISGCQRLGSLPDLPSSLKCLISRNVTSLKTVSGLPSSLTSLNISECSSLGDISALPSSLTTLWASNCYSLVTLSSTPGGLKNLQILDLRGCSSLEEIEGADEKLDSLVDFKIDGCKRLKKIPKLRGSKYLRTLKLLWNHVISDFEGEGMDSLEALVVEECKSLIKIPYLQDSKSLKKLAIMGCPTLSKIEHLECYECLQELGINNATSLERLPADLSRLKELRILKIAGCRKLTHIPGLSRLESLRRLIIVECPLIPRLLDLPNNLSNIEILNCKNLSEIRGFDRLEFLEILNSSWCKSLKRLHCQPKSVVKHLLISDCKNLSEIHGFDRIEFLEELTISGCESLERLHSLPENVKHLLIRDCRNLTEIQGMFLERLDICACDSFKIHDLSNFRNLKNLKIVDIKNLTGIHGGCESSERILDLSNFQNLVELHFLYGQTLTEIQAGNGLLESLKILDIRDSISLVRLPDLSNFKNLEELNVIRCRKLTKIQAGNELEFLQTLDTNGCESLETLPDLSNFKNLKRLTVAGCKTLTEIQAGNGLEFLHTLDAEGCESLETLPDLSNFKNLEELHLKHCMKLTKIQGGNGLEFLQSLDIARCVNLTEIQAGDELWKSLKVLDIRGCRSLVKLPDLTQSKKLLKLNLLNAKYYGSQEEFLAAGISETNRW